MFRLLVVVVALFASGCAAPSAPNPPTPAPTQIVDRDELIGRAMRDLVGRDPTPAEVEAFRADKSPDAYERLVDRLLASPEYGAKQSLPPGTSIDDYLRTRLADDLQPAIVVQVLARRHEWLFRVPGPDGDGKPAGFDKDGGKWCLYSDTLIVPMGSRVVLHLASKDVAHSFFVPELRLKADIPPGELTIADFSAARFAAKPVPAGTGLELPILCAEYCGAGHAKMTAKLLVLRPADFAERTKALQADRDASIKAAGFPRDPRRTAAETKDLWAGFPQPKLTP